MRITTPPGTRHEFPSPKQLRLRTVAEAAHYAKVSTQTIRRWIRSGSLKFYRGGRQIRIDESDLVNFLSP